MQSSATWKTFFQNWPASINRKGIVVNTLGEALPFKAFMLSGEMVLLERTNPDTLGTRYIMLPYEAVACVKFVDPSTTKAFTSFGLEGNLST